MTVPASDDVQQSPPIPPRQREGVLGTARRLAFREPSPEELSRFLNPDQQPTTETGEGPQPEADAYDSAGPQSAETGPSDSAETGSKGSATQGAKRRSIFASEEAKKTARNGVYLASVQAQRMLIRTQAELDLARYIADAEDQENIGDPLANIAARRAGSALSDNPDVNDGVQALLGLGNYIVKQFQIGAIARRMTADANAPETIPGEVA